MSMAFTFVALSPALTSFRDQMSESYSDCSWQPVAHPPAHPPPPWPGRPISWDRGSCPRKVGNPSPFGCYVINSLDTHMYAPRCLAFRR